MSGATVTSAQTQRVFEGDSHDLNMTNVTKGNKIHAIISGGMINAETTVCQYKTGIRFVEHNPSQHIPYDYWTTSHIGGDFSPDLYHPGPCVQATHVVQFTGNMSIKRGTWTNHTNTNCSWTGASPDSYDYGPVRYFAMEIQQ